MSLKSWREKVHARTHARPGTSERIHAMKVEMRQVEIALVKRLIANCSEENWTGRMSLNDRLEKLHTELDALLVGALRPPYERL